MQTDVIYIPLLVLFASYLLGSVSFAIVVSHIMGLPDPRDYGSRNPGATNVLRSGKRWAAFFTLLGDGLKGWLSVAFAQFLSNFCEAGSLVIACGVVAVFIGHVYPIFFGFHGGKGVATAAGILLAISPILGIFTIGIWIFVAYFFGYSSLAALISTCFGVICVIFYSGASMVSLAMLLIGTILIVRHKKNIMNLLTGQEAKIGSKSRVH